MRAASGLSIAVFFLAASLVQPEEWSRFRGPNGQGISTATGFPVEFSRTKNLEWRTPVRPGKSSPVLTNKHVFLTGFEKLFTPNASTEVPASYSGNAPNLSFIKEGVNLLNHSAAITPVTDGTRCLRLLQSVEAEQSIGEGLSTACACKMSSVETHAVLPGMRVRELANECSVLTLFLGFRESVSGGSRRTTVPLGSRSGPSYLHGSSVFPDREFRVRWRQLGLAHRPGSDSKH